MKAILYAKQEYKNNLSGCDVCYSIECKYYQIMSNTPVELHFLISSIVVITSALVFYTIGVWGERLQKQLKGWHVIFFFMGLFCDTVGTSLMAHIAHLLGHYNKLHAITGIIAIVLMFIHAAWAIWTYFKGSPKARANFNKFSIVVWAIWLIPYFIGMYIGMSSMH